MAMSDSAREGVLDPVLLSVNNYYYYRGGAETVFLEHNRMFEARGWQVLPFSMRHPKNLSTPWSEYFIDEIEFGEEYSFFEKLRRVPKVIYSFESRAKLDQMIKRQRPDLCHAHNLYHHISPSILGLLKDRGIPTVLTLHDLKIACPAYNMLAEDGICERCKGGRLHNVVAKRCIKGSLALSAVVMAESVLHRLIGSYRHCVNRFLVPSRFYGEKLSEWGMPKDMFRHVPNFIDPAKYQAKYAPGRRVVYFGRVSREKGLSTLIRAAAAVKCPLSIIGTGPQLGELRQIAVNSNADVEFLGYLSGDELKSAVRSARAVVLPSEWYENAPMSILEAYALGKPVLGARIGGIPELIREGETGAGFVSADVASLAGLLQTFAGMSDSDLEEMGRGGRRWVETEFTAKIYADRMEAIYSELGVGSAKIADGFTPSRLG